MLEIQKLGMVEFSKALDYQFKVVKAKQDGLKTDFLLLLEHNHVFTVGKGGNKNNILEKGLPVVVTNRGGDVTYHGPGQLVGYMIFDLKSSRIDIHHYLRSMESLIISVLDELDIDAYRIDEVTGIWTCNKKIASLGVGVKKGITMHGFALNVCTDLSFFLKINPCGFNSNIMTSIREITGKEIPMSIIEDLFVKKISYFFQ